MRRGDLPGQMLFPAMQEPDVAKTKPPHPDPLAQVARLKSVSGRELDAGGKATALLLYIHARWYGRDLDTFVAKRMAGLLSDDPDAVTPEPVLSGARAAQADLGLAADDMLALLAAYLEAHDPAEPDAPPPGDWIRAFLAEDAPAAEPPKTKARGSARPLLGARVRYQHGPRVVIGRVTAESGDRVTVTGEDGGAWPDVERRLCKPIKESESAPEADDPAAPADVAIRIRRKTAARLQTLLDGGRPLDPRHAPGAVIARFEAPCDHHLLALEVVAPEAGDGTPYAVVAVEKGTVLVDELPPSRTLLGRRTARVAGRPVRLDVVAD